MDRQPQLINHDVIQLELEIERTITGELSNCQNLATGMAGASISPAAFSAMRGEPVPSSCPWCGEQQVPTAEHVASRCNGLNEIRRQHRVHNFRIACVMQRRLGWPTLVAHDELVLDWPGYVRKQFLDGRYRSNL